MTQHILFDLDDTLCDYSGAVYDAKLAISELLIDAAINIETFWVLFHEINNYLFKKFTENKLSKSEYQITRFKDTLLAMGFDEPVLSKKINIIYIELTHTNIRVFPEVIPVLTRLKSSNIGLAILTNGPAEGQIRKIEHLQIDGFFDHVFIGEDIGFSKPDPRCYEHILRILAKSPNELIMVGDSIDYDILGASRVGIPAILIDRFENSQQYKGIKIDNLLQIFPLLESKFQ